MTKQEYKEIEKQFNERLKTSRKENIKCIICITHNPYDIGRNVN